jgi:thiol:disulfide interchange protein
MVPVAGIDPTTATFIIAILVLAAGLWLALAAIKANNDNSTQQAFAAVGVLFGLLAAGGLGGLFANQAAKSASEATASQTETATEQVSEEVSDLSEQVEEALEPGQGKGSSGSGNQKGQAGGAGAQAGGSGGQGGAGAK